MTNTVYFLSMLTSIWLFLFILFLFLLSSFSIHNFSFSCPLYISHLTTFWDCLDWTLAHQLLSGSKFSSFNINLVSRPSRFSSFWQRQVEFSFLIGKLFSFFSGSRQANGKRNKKQKPTIENINNTNTSQYWPLKKRHRPKALLRLVFRTRNFRDPTTFHFGCSCFVNSLWHTVRTRYFWYFWCF